eukprot:TRINITY_DN541_c0_g1_i4.p1 TRINITY_DN541_c0_g1~~TRINITY_DN541_c0_g1_i4.p1  ORF type:complete len:136 (-),score=4.35 TRINITY_DN541_c0_g1_i4:310-717(-)
MRGGLLRQAFLVTLVAQVILGLANSLFVLADVNVALSLFGFYGCLKDNLQSLICYIVFCSVFSTIMDTIRLLLWEPTLLGRTLGYMNALHSYYLMLVLFGVGLKVVGGIFALFLSRKLKRTESRVSEYEKAQIVD